MSTKTPFCKSFDWSKLCDIEWFDGTGYMTLDENRRAVIELDGQPQNRNYDRFTVKIINKHDGEIAREVFRFDAFLDRNKRKDNRNDYPEGGNKTYYGWSARQGESVVWYIAVPKDTAPLVAAIKKFIELFW